MYSSYNIAEGLPKQTTTSQQIVATGADRCRLEPNDVFKQTHNQSLPPAVASSFAETLLEDRVPQCG